MPHQTLPDAIDAALRNARSAVRIIPERSAHDGRPLFRVVVLRGNMPGFPAGSWFTASFYSATIGHSSALSRRHVAIVARVLQRLGWDAADAFSVAIRESGTTGTARETVLRILGN